MVTIMVLCTHDATTPFPRQMGATRIMTMSRHTSRQRLSLEFGATGIITEPGADGVARI